MRVGELFAGIGGFGLGFERAGYEIAWQVEIDPYCRAVLAKHFPDAQRFEDVREVGAHNLEPVDVICGSFPCQPVSDAGAKKAQSDARWLWPEFARVIRELRPRYAVLENVPGLLRRGFGDVLGDLAESGYDAEWDCIPAAAFGAPHLRDRIWVVAYPDEERCVRRPRVFGPGWWRELEDCPRWPPEPAVDRVAHGIPGATHRIAALGNAVVPAIPAFLAHRLLSYEKGGVG